MFCTATAGNQSKVMNRGNKCLDSEATNPNSDENTFVFTLIRIRAVGLHANMLILKLPGSSLVGWGGCYDCDRLLQKRLSEAHDGCWCCCCLGNRLFETHPECKDVFFLFRDVEDLERLRTNRELRAHGLRLVTDDAPQRPEWMDERMNGWMMQRRQAVSLRTRAYWHPVKSFSWQLL